MNLRAIDAVVPMCVFHGKMGERKGEKGVYELFPFPFILVCSGPQGEARGGVGEGRGD